MLKSAAVLVLACLAAPALAACPNKCSGHGKCGATDQCTCEPHYTGADCADRTCAYGLSWTAESGEGDIIPAGRGLGGYHAYTECSSKGKCDRGTGLCECYDGFTGAGCRRTTCLNDCSGHGRCQTLRQHNASYVAYHAAQFASQYWNANMTRRCTCDGGWEGRDCSKKICPKGDDPLTDCKTDSTTAMGRAHMQIQRVYVVHQSSSSRHCKDTGSSKSTSFLNTRAPGIAAYSSCYYGEIYLANAGDVLGDTATNSGTVGTLVQTTSNQIQVADVDKATTDKKRPYVTVFTDEANNQVPRTFVVETSVTGVAPTGAGVFTVHADFSSDPIQSAQTLDENGIASNGNYGAAKNGYFFHELPGIQGQETTKKMCPKGGPYSYQDQTDGKFPTGSGNAAYDNTKVGCEPDLVAGTATAAANQGGHQLGYIALTYTDMYGSRYTTRPILIDSTAASTQDTTAASADGQYSGTLMSSYNGCRGASYPEDCRGPQLTVANHNPALTAVTCSAAGECSAGAEPGGSHPHWEGPVDRNRDAYFGSFPVSGSSEVTEAAQAGAIKLGASPETGGTVTEAANMYQGFYITIEVGSAVGTYRIKTYAHATTEISAYEYVSGVFQPNSVLKAAGHKFVVHVNHDAGNYDTWRAGNRLLYTADRIRQALQELPNFAIPQINVTNHKRLDTATDTFVGNIFDVTFTSDGTSGQQPLLECIYNANYNKPGAWPRMGNLATTDTSVESCVVQDIYLGTQQYAEHAECSNRGTCDSGTGTCSCFEGFTGEACSDQTVFF